MIGNGGGGWLTIWNDRQLGMIDDDKQWHMTDNSERQKMGNTKQ